MAQFPLGYYDQEGIVEGVNFLLSGPSGLGQNFTGNTFSDQAWLTGNQRAPFVTNPIALEALGADASFTITVPDITLFDIPGTTYNVTGLNIAPGAQTVSINVATLTITLDLANVGPVAGPVEFNVLTPPQIFIADIALATCTQIDAFTYNFVFNVAQPTPPFRNGNNVRVLGAAPVEYNRLYIGTGVVECTTTDVTVQTTNARPILLAPGTGGTIRFSNTNQAINDPITGLPFDTNWLSTDCLGRATVNGPSDRVFLAAQLSNLATYSGPMGPPHDVEYTVAINRYVSFEFFDGASRSGRDDDVLFSFDKTIAQKQILITGLVGTGILDPLAGSNAIDSVFSGVIDNLPIGYYLYKLEIAYRVYQPVGVTTLQITQAELGLRGLTVQVIKE